MTLEEQFKEAVKEAQGQINDALGEACRALSAAEALSEHYGVPFESNISFLSQTYTPKSFFEKFGEVDRDVLWESDIPVGDYEGWEHSAVC